MHSATSPTRTEKIEYRFLSPEEYEWLSPVFKAHGTLVPSPELSAIVVALNEAGQIVGFLVLQLLPHAEPVWISPEYRELVSCHQLFKLVEAPFKEAGQGSIYVFSPDSLIKGLCEDVGFESMGLEVMQKSYDKTKELD